MAHYVCRYLYCWRRVHGGIQKEGLERKKSQEQERGVGVSPENTDSRDNMTGDVKVALLLLTYCVVCAAQSVPPSLRSKLLFYEPFDDVSSLQESWVKSSNAKYNGNAHLKVTTANVLLPSMENDLGLLLSSDMKVYGVSSKVENELVLSDHEDVVIQYEVKLQEPVTCSGAYIKLLSSDPSLDLSEIDDKTRYSIMFGPDKCSPGTNKVHFILQHQNPSNKLFEEKHFNSPSTAKSDRRTHLYTLHLKKDNQFATYIDMKLEKSGHLLESMQPPINPPEFIDDPEDQKPNDWVDVSEIPDPDDKRPDDWDENEPRMIPDASDMKPEGWLDNEPAEIPDPSVLKPEDWSDEEDGEWVAPLVSNPACSAIGCGDWRPRQIKNDKYKGKWSPRKIPNPDYKGVWKPAQMTNPAYFDDKEPLKNVAAIRALAIEVQANNGGILFDNFVIATSLDDAFEVAKLTFSIKQPLEDQMEEQQQKTKLKESREAKLATGSLRDYVEVKMSEFFELFGENAVYAMTAVLTTVILGALSILYLLCFKKSKAVTSTPSAATGPSTRRSARRNKAAEDEGSDGEGDEK